VKKIALVCIGFSLLLGLGSLQLWRWWTLPAGEAGQVVINVGQGSSLASVAATLKREGILRHTQLWQLAARLQGLDSKIKRGEYRLHGGLSPAELLQALVQGRVIHYSVTLPEGIALRQALELLWQESALISVLQSDTDARLLALVAPARSAEGLFFPDTYHYIRGDSDLDVLRLARQRMQVMVDNHWPQRAADLPYSTPYEALIMASVVEKETGLVSERERIAGVFVRRLQRGMRLQTDPTVIYGLGSAYSGNLQRRHLKDRSNPYNSYQQKGLPPTPIALPGEGAIIAALHPASGDELYFVARGDGSHQFSATLEQHQQAVREFQLKRRTDYRSAPAASPEQGKP